MLLSAVNVGAASLKLSTAIDNIAYTAPMVKSEVAGRDISFTADDFSQHLGASPSSITITSLPAENEGMLMLGVSEVLEGQTISSANLELLRFVSRESSPSSFTFTVDKSYATVCNLRFSESTNSAPELGSGAVTTTVTLEDIACYGTLTGSDPDGDTIMFEIVAYPEHGIVTLTDNRSGDFSYTPYEDAVGVDSFSYRVRDEFGNYSAKGEVSLKIEKNKFTEELADMDGHWAESAAISMVSAGFMTAITENGSLYFDPEENITREEYLVTIMKTLGAPELSTTVTAFADNDDIAPEFSGYVSAAHSIGIISGEKTDAGVVFRPKDYITRAEAAVMLNKILGLKAQENAATYFDTSTLPSWAVEDIIALAQVGILNGYGGEFFPEDRLTRAEVANMLFLTDNIFS